MTTSTSTQIVNERYAGFQYSAAINNGNVTSAIEHMAIGSAHNVVANGSRKYLEDGSNVVNFGKTNGNWYAQVGIALGTVNEAKPSYFWPNWGNPDSVVFNVVWVTKIVPVPDTFFVNMGPGKRLSCTDWANIAKYALKNAR